MVKKEPQVQLFVESLNVFVLKNTPPPATLNTKRLPSLVYQSSFSHKGLFTYFNERSEEGGGFFSTIPKKKCQTTGQLSSVP